MKIYTKTGDKGTTRLVDCSCVEKFNPRVEAYGCVDELNSILGAIRSQINIEKSELLNVLQAPLEKIQSELFSVGSLLATADLDTFNKLSQITEQHITQLENWIDTYSAELPELKNFILPSGHLVASFLHMGRTACRRSERRASEIYFTDKHYQNVLIYLNRLSDLLFTWARWTNLKTQHIETLWKST
jgi:cob(I)alamin adenosyltransferase